MVTWWLVSWTTYGTWLPGDERGFCTWREREYIPPPKRYAKAGEPTYQASDYTRVREAAKAKAESPIYFSPSEIHIALNAIVNEIGEIPIAPAIMSLGAWHVHWLCYFGEMKIRSTVGRLKAAATRELNMNGFQGKRPWAKGCNMRSKATRRECRNAYRYILRHREQGCLIYRWHVDPKYLPLK